MSFTIIAGVFLNRYRLWAVMSILCITGCASTVPSYNTIQHVAGVYHGTVNTGNTNSLVVTELFLNDKKVITGKFKIAEKNGLLDGKLTNFHQEGLYTLTATWKSTRGTGSLRMLFFDNCRFFTGIWQDDKKPVLLQWNGVKK